MKKCKWQVSIGVKDGDPRFGEYTIVSVFDTDVVTELEAAQLAHEAMVEYTEDPLSETHDINQLKYNLLPYPDSVIETDSDGLVEVGLMGDSLKDSKSFRDILANSITVEDGWLKFEAKDGAKAFYNLNNITGYAYWKQEDNK